MNTTGEAITEGKDRGVSQVLMFIRTTVNIILEKRKRGVCYSSSHRPIVMHIIYRLCELKQWFL